jgi:hypothetical protein
VADALDRVVAHNHNQTNSEQEASVAHISEHYSEQERERNASENCGVEFLVHGNSVSVDDLLVDPGVVVGLDEGGRSDVMVVEWLELGGRVVLEHVSDDVFLVGGAPEVSHVAALGLLHHVHGVVEGLLLGHEPLVDLQGADLFSVAIIC